MCIYTTNCKSYTGKLIYSDQTYYHCEGGNRPTLNKVANIPIIGRAAGVIRATLAIFHILGHLFAALVTQNRGHLYHAAKGGTELLRGIIEAIPVIGLLFSWGYNGSVYNLPKSHTHYRDCVEVGNWFLIKIYNPENPDHVDEFLKKIGRI